MNLYEKMSNGVYLIAEMSANHGGSLENAFKMIEEAKKAGADCLKIQTYTADTLTINCNKEYFTLRGGLWDGYTYYDLYKEAYTPWEWQKSIKEKCDEVGIDFLSTPFDLTAVDFLEEIGIEFYKIASFELIDIPLIEYVASKGKPMIMSCGMASIEEIEEAIAACRKYNNERIVLLKCCSEYPANYADMNVATIPDMKERFDLPIGLSDHSMGSLAAVVAVSLGAKVIEKHICLDRSIPSADSAFSMEMPEFKNMVKDVENAYLIKGRATYELTKKETESLVIRRSLFAVKDIQMGEVFTKENLRSIRPGNGIKPKYYQGLLGKKAKQNYEYGDPIHGIEIAVLRKAELQDMELLFEWTNEEAVRKNSIDSHRIEWEEHKNWFLNRLNRADTDLFIYLVEGIPVGQIRLDYKDQCAWISFSIDSRYRGQGHGGTMLSLAEEEVKKNRPEINSLAGVVKIENIASRKKFVELQYNINEDYEDKSLILYEKRLF